MDSPAPVTQPSTAIDVIVVNWNGLEHLRDCLPALEAQDYTNFRVIVVDNASSDGSVEWIRQHHPRVLVVETGDNRGFATGNNLGLAASDAPFVALINTDAAPDTAWLSELMAAVTGPDIGGVSSLMVFADRPELVNSTGIALDPAGIAWDRLGGAPVNDPRVQVASEVFGPSAGACLYRRAALDDVAEAATASSAEHVTAIEPATAPAGHATPGPTVFDPAFFMYLEDVDLAWRLRLRGWRSVYAPAARVRHVGSGTSGEGSAFKNRLLARNKVWSVLKCYPTRPLLVWLPFVIAYDVASIPYRLLWYGQTSALRGRLDAMRRLRTVWRQRGRIQARRTASWPEISFAMEPLDAPWAVLARYRHLHPREPVVPPQ